MYIERKYQIDRKYRPDPAWEREELLNSIDDIYNATRHGKGMVLFNLTLNSRIPYENF